MRWGGTRFSLSYRNVEELLTERGLPADHTTIWRWVQCYAPELNKRCRRELKPTNRSWRVDETYVRVKGRWTYLYRAVDSTGATIDFRLAARRDAAAVKRFFQNALRAPGHLVATQERPPGSSRRPAGFFAAVGNSEQLVAMRRVAPEHRGAFCSTPSTEHDELDRSLVVGQAADIHAHLQARIERRALLEHGEDPAPRRGRPTKTA